MVLQEYEQITIFIYARWICNNVCKTNHIATISVSSALEAITGSENRNLAACVLSLIKPPILAYGPRGGLLENDPCTEQIISKFLYRWSQNKNFLSNRCICKTVTRLVSHLNVLTLMSWIQTSRLIRVFWKVSSFLLSQIVPKTATTTTCQAFAFKSFGTDFNRRPAKSKLVSNNTCLS